MKRRFKVLAMMFIMILLLSSCGNTIPIELKSSIQDGTITYEKIESNNWEDIIETKEFREYFANTLTEYQKEDAVEKALDLIYEISIGYKDETYINGGYLYASDTFVNWIKNAVLNDHIGTKKYEFAWDKDSILNQIGFCSEGDIVPVSILTLNSFYDIEENDSVQVGDSNANIKAVDESFNKNSEPWKENEKNDSTSIDDYDYDDSDYESDYDYDDSDYEDYDIEEDAESTELCSICGGKMICNYCGESGLYCYNASFGTGQRHYCSTHWADIAEDSVYNEEADIYYDYDLWDPETGYDYQFDTYQ